MSASELNILHSSWEDEEKVKNDLESCCSKINGIFYDGDEVQIHKEYPDRQAYLILEIESEKSLEWYFEQYPSAKSEPEECIPYFVFDDEINNGERLVTIVNANCSLDDELIYEFFKEYLNLNPEKYVHVDASIWFNKERIEKQESLGGYKKGWLMNLEKV